MTYVAIARSMHQPPAAMQRPADAIVTALEKPPTRYRGHFNQTDGTLDLILESISSSNRIFPVLILSTVIVTIASGCLTTFQLLLLLALTALTTLARKGNRLFARKMTIVHRDDVSTSPFSTIHVLLGWSFGPIFILSMFSPWASAALLFGLLVFFAKPVALLIGSTKTGHDAAACAR